MKEKTLEEKYIEHEVEIRVMKEVTSEKFNFMKNDFTRLEFKLNSLIALAISSIILPVFLHWTKIL